MSAQMDDATRKSPGALPPAGVRPPLRDGNVAMVPDDEFIPLSEYTRPKREPHSRTLIRR